MSTSSKLVSIIIPILNRFFYAHETIASVFNQTYRPIELIIVDDCSDTPFNPKIHTTKDFVEKFVRHEENQGPGSSCETGRLVANGNYIAYLDSDDLWHSEKLAKQVTLLDKTISSIELLCLCKIF